MKILPECPEPQLLDYFPPQQCPGQLKFTELTPFRLDTIWNWLVYGLETWIGRDEVVMLGSSV